MVKTPRSQGKGHGLTSGQATKIPGAVWSNLKKKNRKEKKSSVAMKQGPTIPDLVLHRLALGELVQSSKNSGSALESEKHVAG